MINDNVGLKKACVLCILKNNDEILLLLRNKEPNLGSYTGVGGKIEKFESPKKAALREIQEETGLLLEDVKLAGILTETNPNKFNYINYVYMADIPKYNPHYCNEGKLEWIEYTKLDKIQIPEVDSFIYKNIFNDKFFIIDAIYDEEINLIKAIDEFSGQVLKIYGGKDE